jgi:hypothetical protein
MLEPSFSERTYARFWTPVFEQPPSKFGTGGQTTVSFNTGGPAISVPFAFAECPGAGRNRCFIEVLVGSCRPGGTGTGICSLADLDGTETQVANENPEQPIRIDEHGLEVRCLEAFACDAGRMQIGQTPRFPLGNDSSEPPPGPPRGRGAKSKIENMFKHS